MSAAICVVSFTEKSYRVVQKVSHSSAFVTTRWNVAVDAANGRNDQS